MMRQIGAKCLMFTGTKSLTGRRMPIRTYAVLVAWLAVNRTFER